MGEAALNQFSQELGDTFQVLCCGARPYGTQTPWAPVSQPAQRVQPKPPDVRQSLSRKQVSPHFWPTGRGAGESSKGECLRERWLSNCSNRRREGFGGLLRTRTLALRER